MGAPIFLANSRLIFLIGVGVDGWFEWQSYAGKYHRDGYARRQRQSAASTLIGGRQPTAIVPASNPARVRARRPVALENVAPLCLA